MTDLMGKFLSLQQKRELCEQPATLNFKDAVISGAGNEHATVTTLDGKESFLFSWESVALSNGEFTS